MLSRDTRDRLEAIDKHHENLIPASLAAPASVNDVLFAKALLELSKAIDELKIEVEQAGRLV
jgi:hypothetical protein